MFETANRIVVHGRQDLVERGSCAGICLAVPNIALRNHLGALTNHKKKCTNKVLETVLLTAEMI